MFIIGSGFHLGNGGDYPNNITCEQTYLNSLIEQYFLKQCKVFCYTAFTISTKHAGIIVIKLAPYFPSPPT
jgi:hypothetical protein